MGFIVWLISLLARLLTFAILVDALLSWVPYNDTVYKIRSFLQGFTAPVTEPIRRLLSPITQRIMIDFTPVIAIFVVDFVANLVLRILTRLF